MRCHAWKALGLAARGELAGGLPAQLTALMKPEMPKWERPFREAGGRAEQLGH